MKTLIKKLELHLQSVPTKIQKIPLEILEHKPLPHKWSKKEILGHLVDSAQNNWRRFVEAQYSKDFYQVHGYNQDEYVRINAYQQMPLQEVVQTWITLNQRIVNVWEQIPTEKLATKVINTDGTASTLQWWITDYVQHLEHHLRQIFADASSEEKKK